MEEEYSTEWNNVLETANEYHRKISLFLACSDSIKVYDLKKALLDRNATYYALKIIENISDKIKMELMNELLYVIIFSNSSYSYLAKQIIFSLDKDLVKPKIMELYKNYVFQNKLDVYVIKDMAQFLYELRYKNELLKFIQSHHDSLIQTEFIESDDDIDEIKNMEDS
jgi:hypothetical protein